MENKVTMKDRIQKALNSVGTFLQEAFRVESRKNPYPKSVEECLDENIVYKPATFAAMEKFKKSHPWRGTQAEMQFKLRVLNQELSEIYEIQTPQLVFVDKFPVGACCFPTSKPAVIMMEPERDGRYSIVCFLHEYGHALGKDEKETCKWSINLFKKVFPKSYEKLDHVGHLLVKKAT